jgi:hypothetical protein
VAALAATTAALRECGVTVNPYSAAAALHRLDYVLAGDTVAAVGWCDGMFVDPDLPPEVTALVRAHAHLSCAAAPSPTPLAPACSSGCSGESFHPSSEV